MTLNVFSDVANFLYAITENVTDINCADKRTENNKWAVTLSIVTELNDCSRSQVCHVR